MNDFDLMNTLKWKELAEVEEYLDLPMDEWTESKSKSKLAFAMQYMMAKRNNPALTIGEAEEMSMEKPWYKRIFEKLTDWLSKFRRKAIDTSIKLEELVDEFEHSLETAKSPEEMYKEREIEMVNRKAMTRGIY